MRNGMSISVVMSFNGSIQPTPRGTDCRGQYREDSKEPWGVNQGNKSARFCGAGSGQAAGIKEKIMKRFIIPMWYPSLQLLAQLGHLLLGLVSVFGPIAVTLDNRYGIYGTIVVSAYFVIKELTFDIWIEGDSYWDAVVDTFWFGVGLLTAWILIWVI
jgi:hypothetical protein